MTIASLALDAPAASACIADKPILVAEYHVWEERLSDRKMEMNYACG